MYAIELVEGKDRPRELGPKKFHEKYTTASHLLHLIGSIAHSGRVVIMDSGFCVLQALTALFSTGIFSSVVIKKQRYWPRYVEEGDAIDKQFEGKAVGTMETLPDKLDGVDFKIMSMKEEDYVMKLMTTYGSEVEVDDGATQRTEAENGLKVTKHFKYTETFYNHFKFRHQVDNHNNLRHAPISFEVSVNTKDWLEDPCFYVYHCPR